MRTAVPENESENSCPHSTHAHPHPHPQRAHNSLDWNFLLQLWSLLGDWKLLARCRAAVEKRMGRGRWGGKKSLLNM